MIIRFIYVIIFGFEEGSGGNGIIGICFYWNSVRVIYQEQGCWKEVIVLEEFGYY